MPVIYRCSKCGKIIYVFWRVGQSSYGVPTPSELASMYGGLCPYCGKPLNTKPTFRDVKIYTRRSVPRDLLKELQRLPKPL